MSRTVLLDAGPLGLATNPRRSARSVACAQWLQSLVAAGVRVIVPEIADYEVRRELARANKTRGIAQLDALARLLEYLPLTTGAMRQAAVFWAQARQQGQPTAGDKTIDGDMILAGQARTLGVPDVVIATTNVGHLSRFALRTCGGTSRIPDESAGRVGPGPECACTSAKTPGDEPAAGQAGGGRRLGMGLSSLYRRIAELGIQTQTN